MRIREFLTRLLGPRSPRSEQPRSVPPRPEVTYPGDFMGPAQPTYSPTPDHLPDPGEIVWTWVPYEEDYTRGKDRPVLIIGADDPWLLGLPLTSKDHDRDLEQERQSGREWLDIGSGSWDRRGRPSEVRTNRVVRVAPAQVRREGSALPPEVYAVVAEAVARATAHRGRDLPRT